MLTETEARLALLVEEVRDPTLKAMIQPGVTNIVNSKKALQEIVMDLKERPYVPVQSE